MKITRLYSLTAMLITTSLAFAQTTTTMNTPANKDSLVIKKIYDEELSKGKSYELLEFLSTRIGSRLSGSPQAAKAIDWAYNKMEELQFDTVFLQDVMVPHWVRGDKEVARILFPNSVQTKDVSICALGGSVGTGVSGINANVVEVKSFEELAALGERRVKGKIVFFNRPMDPTHINTFAAYGGAVDQRSRGAIEAAKLGAVGVVVRSMTLRTDDYPHTGVMGYDETITKIPAAAISTMGADLLSNLLKKEPELSFFFKMNCETLPDAPSHNVVGEIRGSEFPDEIIVVGGHYDSWDLGDGSHDDGAGCMQSIEVLRLFKTLGMHPKRTIRAVMFINEENGLRGGLKYAELAKLNGEKHIAAIESDAGGFTPREFQVDADIAIVEKMQKWEPLFAPYLINQIVKGGGGGDISPLKDQGVPLIGYRPDDQRYFDFHHAATNTFDAINQRELELGAAAMTALVYLLSEYGL